MPACLRACVLCCIVLCWYGCGAAVVVEAVESGGYGCIFRAANGARVDEVDEWMWLLDRRRRSGGARVAVC
jgi:hypothetical protein